MELIGDEEVRTTVIIVFVLYYLIYSLITLIELMIHDAVQGAHLNDLLS